jgi:hypothetical protein
VVQRSAQITPERASIRGTVRLAGHAASDVSVSVQGESVPLAADGSFTAQVEEAGFVTVAASSTREDLGKRLPCPSASAIVALDGSRSYRVDLALCTP